MKFSEIIIKALRITLIPGIEWKTIAEERESKKEILWGFAFPIILFSAIGRDIGLFFVVKPVLGFTLNLALMLFFNLLSWVVIPYLLVLIGTFMLNFSLPSLGIETDYIRTLRLVIYSFTPLFIVTFFVYLHPLLRILIPIGFFVFMAYTLYVFWYGLKELYQIPLEKKFRFVIIAIVWAFLVIFIAQHLYGLLLGLVMPGMEAYVK